MKTTDPKPIDPTHCTIAQAAELLTKEGGKPITVAMIEQDVKAGAPLNEDGSLNVIVYGSWTLKQQGK